MLHVATVHWRDGGWIDPQLRYLRRFTPPGTQVWASLDEIPLTAGSGFDHVMSIEAEGVPEHETPSEAHAWKLDALAARILAAAGPDDHLLFLDGDAFPIAPVAPLLDAPEPLVAVRRTENRGEMQPHPCFTLTTAALWADLGSWATGPTHEWGPIDVGGALREALDRREIGWRALTRVNTTDLDPLWFGVYGDDRFGPVAYHHGAGFRTRVDRTHRAAPERAVLGRIPLLPRIERSIQWRWRQTAMFARVSHRRSTDLDRTVRGWIGEDDNVADRFVG